MFDSAWTPQEEPTSVANRHASSVHLFSLVNIMHDVNLLLSTNI
jgi:hypothetical protein